MKNAFQMALAVSALTVSVGAFAKPGDDPSIAVYKCHAQATGGGYDKDARIYVSNGWFASKSRAEDSALGACRAESSYPEDCVITSCSKTIQQQ